MIREQLSETRLEPTEITILRKAFFGTYLQALLVSILFGVLSLPAPFFPDRHGKLHLPTSFQAYFHQMSEWFVMALGLCLLIALCLSATLFLDLIAQSKLTGKWIIKRKWTTKKKYFLACGPVKKMEIEQQEYASLLEGGLLEMELAKYSKYVFRKQKISQ